MSDFYDNKELYAAYPELADIAVFIDDAEGALGAYGEADSGFDYDEDFDEDGGNTEGPGLKSIRINEGLTLAEKKKTLLHEIQHAIQEIEGFAPSIDSANYREYHKSAGEVEARNVETRARLTPEERRAKLLADTEDVARDDQLFLREAAGQSKAQSADNVGMDANPPKKSSPPSLSAMLTQEGIPPDDPTAPLFQLTEEAILQDAAKYDTLEDWRKSADEAAAEADFDTENTAYGAAPEGANWDDWLTKKVRGSPRRG